MNKLDNYRAKIDDIDFEIIKLLEERFKVVEKIKEYKYVNDLNVRDYNRELVIIDKIKSYNLEKEKEIIDVYKDIFKVSKKAQEK
ncbi:MAG: chorismate mutase [Bacilli bacterium]|jgi:chorismate mutase/prephenate dehydratase|nr:chorismate mutase [Bacilli bacterium]